MFQKNKKLTFLTAYDFLTAQILEEAKINAILVGDSLGMVFEGKTNTHEVTIEQMCYHTKIVKRGAPNTPIIGDMPINTYLNSKKTSPG
jgi:3-methyl-2-oxobutanoate hydroxymethyltransferase